PLLATGLGVGAFEAPNVAAALGAVPRTQRGVAGAAIALFGNVGMTIGTAAAASLIGWEISHGHGSMAERVTGGVPPALLLGAGAAGVAALTAMAQRSHAEP